MQIINLRIIIFTFFSLFPVTLSFGITCDDMTTESKHSPYCKDNWVVNDPNRITSILIQHSPSYHTYSKWKIGIDEIIIAYNDNDNEPTDMTADIYKVINDKYKHIGSVDISGYVTNVRSIRITGSQNENIVFEFNNGQLQYFSIIDISNNKVNVLFQYGASEITIQNDKPIQIIAKSKSLNIIERFIWSKSKHKFIKKGTP